MRRQLLLELVAILPRSRSTHIPNDGDMEDEGSSGYSGLKEEHVVKASALLRLYCALMGIAGLRYVRFSRGTGWYNPDSFSTLLIELFTKGMLPRCHHCNTRQRRGWVCPVIFDSKIDLMCICLFVDFEIWKYSEQSVNLFNVILLQTHGWRGRTTFAVDDQQTPSHSCRCSLRVSVLLQAAGLSNSGQVHKSIPINSYFDKFLLHLLNTNSLAMKKIFICEQLLSFFQCMLPGRSSLCVFWLLLFFEC